MKTFPHATNPSKCTSAILCVVSLCLSVQDKFLEGKDMSTYIGTVTSKPGSEAPGTNFPKWKSGGVSYLSPSVCYVDGVVMAITDGCSRSQPYHSLQGD